MPRLFWLIRDRRVPFRSPVRSGMHLEDIAVDGRLAGGVPPRVGVQVDETEDEGVHEKCDASRGRSNQKA